MVGHTGNLGAAIIAMETIDQCVGRIDKAMKNSGGTIFLTADHGNLELMVNPETGGPHTAHTTFPVPFVMCEPTDRFRLTRNGKLADIAPTILDYLQIPIPKEMDGISRLKR